jgi:hypothetical protein
MRRLEKLERAIVSEGVITQTGALYYPEREILTGGKHGIDWTEGQARADNPLDRAQQGKFGKPEDVQFAVEQAAARLAIGGTDTFELYPGHGCVYYERGGQGVPHRASQVFVWVRPDGADGKIHAYPVA